MDGASDADVAEFVAALDGFFDRRPDAGPDRWAALCGIGLPALRVGEPHGLGASLRAATAVAERLGGALVPEPAGTAIAVAHALDRFGGPAELRDALIEGSRVVSPADFERATLTAEGTFTGSVVVADDTLGDLVAILADSALVIIDKDVIPSGADRCEVDPTRPTRKCELAGAPTLLTLRLPPESVREIADELALLTISELVGGMHTVLTETVEFVRGREQFGRSIGSFQVVKHTLADLYTATEQARAAVQFAAISCDEHRQDASHDVAAATRWVVRSAIDTFERALHLHGAMGYSWEVNIHLHLRRAFAAHQTLPGLAEFAA